MNYVITQECGQKWYRWRSWFKYRYPINTILDQIGTPNFRIRKIWEWEYTLKPGSHKLVGFAIGPIMFFKKEYYFDDYF